MSVDYDAARDFVKRLAEKTSREELESDSKYYDEETSDETKQKDADSAEDIKTAIEFGGDLLIDIAESLNTIASGDKLRGGRRMS